MFTSESTISGYLTLEQGTLAYNEPYYTLLDCNIYSLFQKEALVENVHLAKDVHDYGVNKRMALYPFLAKHLGMDMNLVLNKRGEVDENKSVILTNQELRVCNAQHPIPANALQGDDAVMSML